MCGISSIIPVTPSGSGDNRQVTGECLSDLAALLKEIENNVWSRCCPEGRTATDRYLGGQDTLERLWHMSCRLKTDACFYHLFAEGADYQKALDATARLEAVIAGEAEVMERQETARLDAAEGEAVAARFEKIRDICWCLKHEVCGNIVKTRDLAASGITTYAAIILLKKINAVFNSLDRLEVRGRDSAGLSILFSLTEDSFKRFSTVLEQSGLGEELKQRCGDDILTHRTIRVSRDKSTGTVGLAFVYKYAAEIGRLGDNVRFLRRAVSEDAVFHGMLAAAWQDYTISSHTRWASVGTITEANCHPMDGLTGRPESREHIIHACLNGDIDNYRQLKSEHEAAGEVIAADITTDTKIIPVRIGRYVRQGHDIIDAFRLAVSDFTGAHAISMHTDLAPGKMFFAQRGSGQALFIGLAENHYVVASELYGVVEETSRFIKMNAGGTAAADEQAPGQIVVLDRAAGGLEGIAAMRYDGTPVTFSEKDILRTEITSRDVDRQEYEHYFLKEISEAPQSIEKTLRNRWQTAADDPGIFEVRLSPDVIPASLAEALKKNLIRRVFFIGQGTAGVAALAGANILRYYLSDPAITVRAVKSSELSGFNLTITDSARSMSDTLVVAVSQSGTTTDTNRAVDMVRGLGAHTLAIVNRRDSDLTFKTDGVFYTSTGRDIEMSVASTKAFYSQVVAAAMLSLYIVGLKGDRDREFISNEIRQLSKLPSALRKIFSRRDDIRAVAQRLAATRTYWAVVGSGPNKASADEIRIKLSELCYRTISSDFVEDKKHIDLSAEPLIIVCAAGSRPGVLDDIIKDTAIFRAHKAIPVVIADEGEDRFSHYAAAVIPVPQTAEHFGPVVNTFAGHLWGYYAALAINEGSRMLHAFREEIRNEIAECRRRSLDVFEIVLEKGFREKVISFYHKIRGIRKDIIAPSCIAMASDLVLLLKYLAGRLPLSDFELDFGRTGTAPNMLNTLFEFVDESINQMARPIDAIKHQAKTVTVGTSRITQTMEGILFDALTAYGMGLSQLTNSNVVVLKNLQGIVAGIKGAILYEVDRLNLLGEPTDETTITILKKDGVLAAIPSRVESDNRLKGTKKIIVREGNVYIGKGRKDDRSIVVIPVLSSSASTGGMIRYILLINIAFREDAALAAKKKALGGKSERIKNIVQENNVAWQDHFLELVGIKDLFGLSAEKLAEAIVARVESGAASS
ncbi:MAG: SIS domain-containing protein [Thermodesulfobacteriota bacterium]